MNKNSARRTALATAFVLLALLLSANLHVLLATDTDPNSGDTSDTPPCGWVLVANNVYHCTTGGIGGCSPCSAHTWLPAAPDTPPTGH